MPLSAAAAAGEDYEDCTATCAVTSSADTLAMHSVRLLDCCCASDILTAMSANWAMPLAFRVDLPVQICPMNAMSYVHQASAHRIRAHTFTLLLCGTRSLTAMGKGPHSPDGATCLLNSLSLASDQQYHWRPTVPLATNSTTSDQQYH